jgi:hypothetical protein
MRVTYTRDFLSKILATLIERDYNYSMNCESIHSSHVQRFDSTVCSRLSVVYGIGIGVLVAFYATNLKRDTTRKRISEMANHSKTGSELVFVYR